MSRTQEDSAKDPETDPDLATRSDVQKALAEGSEVLVDVMKAESYRREHIPGAISLPLIDLPRQARKVLPDPAKPVIVYCAGYS
jgi:rhodanese-related sulfurtransferase